MAEQAQPQVGISRIYLKDLSFESPEAPEIFRAPLQPEIKVDVTVRQTQLEGNLYEVSVDVTATGMQGEKKVFIVEVEMAGLFQIQNVPAEHMPHVLRVYCPNVLFPYVRQSMDMAMTSGGLPAMILPPFNFEALLRASPQPN